MQVVEYVFKVLGIRGVGFRFDLNACLFGVTMRDVKTVSDGEEEKATLLCFHIGPFGLAAIF